MVFKVLLCHLIIPIFHNFRRGIRCRTIPIRMVIGRFVRILGSFPLNQGNHVFFPDACADARVGFHQPVDHVIRGLQDARAKPAVHPLPFLVIQGAAGIGTYHRIFSRIVLVKGQLCVCCRFRRKHLLIEGELGVIDQTLIPFRDTGMSAFFDDIFFDLQLGPVFHIGHLRRLGPLGSARMVGFLCHMIVAVHGDCGNVLWQILRGLSLCQIVRHQVVRFVDGLQIPVGVALGHADFHRRILGFLGQVFEFHLPVRCRGLYLFQLVGTVLQLLIEGDYRARKPVGFLGKRIFPTVIIGFGHFQAGNGLVDQFQLLPVRSGGRRLSRRQLHCKDFPAGRIAVWRRNLPDFILNLLPIFVVDRKTRKGCKSRGSSARRFLDRFCFSLSVNADNSPGKRHRIALGNGPVFGHGHRAGIGVVDDGLPIGIHVLLLLYFIGTEEKSIFGSFSLFFCIQLRMGRGIQDAVGIALRHHFFQIIGSRRHLKVRARCQSQGLFIIPADTFEILPLLFIDFKRHAGQGGFFTCRVLFDFAHPESGIRPVGQGNHLCLSIDIHRSHAG